MIEINKESTKPRIRVLYDQKGLVNEVRVLINAPEEFSLIHDQLGGLISVETCKRTQKVCSIRINCSRLSGREYEHDFITLLSILDEASNRKDLPITGKLLKKITEYKEKVGEERIVTMREAMKAETNKKWGKLHELVADIASVNYPHVPDVGAFLTFLKGTGDKLFDYLHETIQICLDEYKTADNYNYQTCITTALSVLTDKEQTKAFYQQCVKIYVQRAQWQALVPYIQSFRPAPDAIDILKTIYNEMTEIESPESSNIRMLLLQSCEALAYSLPRPSNDLNETIQFLINVVNHDPDANVRSYASSVREDLDMLVVEPEEAVNQMNIELGL